MVTFGHISNGRNLSIMMKIKNSIVAFTCTFSFVCNILSNLSRQRSVQQNRPYFFLLVLQEYFSYYYKYLPSITSMDTNIIDYLCSNFGKLQELVNNF